MPGGLNESVTIAKNPFTGTYEYSVNSQKGQYTYYKKSGNGYDKDHSIHFSVVQQKSSGGGIKFHISVPVTMAGGSGNYNLHVNYFIPPNSKKEPKFGIATANSEVPNNINEIPTSSGQKKVTDWYEQNKATLLLVAQEISTNLNPKLFAMAVARRSARAAATPILSHANLAETPILSQASAVGQGFDIFGSFETKSLMRPLVDSSHAPTQVFTFLGKDYLIPGYVTAVESTSSYSNVGAGVNREGFQNSIAAHAGVEGSYGAFSGEMSADFTGEYKENALFTYGFIDFYTALATLQLNNSTEYLSSEFLSAVADVPSGAIEENLPEFIDFFTRWGVYYTDRITLGGSLGFYTALSKRETLSKAGFEFALKGQYKGLFASGQLDANVAASAEWQQYSEASVTNLRVLGGAPNAAAALASVDPLGFSAATVAAFKGWTDSVVSAPAIVDFSLKGIWNLAGDKREILQAAWELFGRTMRPRLTVETAAGNTPWPTPPATPPVITIGQLIRPEDRPASPAGFQVVVLDGSDVNPDGVLLNRYFCVPLQPSWQGVYESMYEDMVTALQAPGLAAVGNVLVLASFGLDQSMPPTDDFYALLMSAGSGNLLRQWIATADPGSQIGNPSLWIGSPANYCLVGLFGSGPDTGVEAYNTAESAAPANLRAEALFYRTSITGQYTLGGGA